MHMSNMVEIELFPWWTRLFDIFPLKVDAPGIQNFLASRVHLIKTIRKEPRRRNLRNDILFTIALIILGSHWRKLRLYSQWTLHGCVTPTFFNPTGPIVNPLWRIIEDPCELFHTGNLICFFKEQCDFIQMRCQWFRIVFIVLRSVWCLMRLKNHTLRNHLNLPNTNIISWNMMGHWKLRGLPLKIE